MVYRVYVEKKEGQRHEASGLLREIKDFLQIENLTLDMSRTKGDPQNPRLMLLRDVEGMSMRGFRLVGAQKPLIEIVDGRNLIFEDWQTEGISPEVRFEGDLTGDIRFYNSPGWEHFSR